MDRKNGIIIAIDGPTASGKSTTAKKVAQRLNFVHLNTGAMYRAFALLVKMSHTMTSDRETVHMLLEKAKITFDRTGAIHLDNTDVSRDILAPDIALLASELSTFDDVRTKLVEKQRLIGEHGGVVLEGRDIGTVVFPDAELKIFLVAHPDIRAERRQAELIKLGTHVELNELKQQLIERDKRDRERAISPLKKASDAIELDTSNLTIDGQVENVYRLALERMNGANAERVSSGRSF